VARRTFFSFHYDLDVSRAWVVRNSWVAKVAQGDRESAGFFDSSVFEASKRQSDESLKRFLREGLENTSVTCVLVGAETALRRWVRYEILRSFMCGNGVLAVRIHSIAGLNGAKAGVGSNPFDNLAFQIVGDRVQFKEYMASGWADARDVQTMPLRDVAYDLGGRTNHTFSNIFPIYDWELDSGYQNLAGWIESAARLSGR
jgi:hypothetical protein